MLKRDTCVATLLILLALPLAGCVTSQAEQEQAARTADADSLLQATMDAHHLPALSVAVSIDGNVVYDTVFGLADEGAGRSASSETVFAQGSITKALTAVMALMLAEENLVDLDAPARRYCPSFPQKQDTVTLRQLLAHTAGVRHYNYRQFEKDYLNHTTYNTIPDALVKFKDDPLVTTPGEKYHYSSWGYVVVACAIEGASGQPFNTFVAQRVLERAGMDHSMMDQPDLVLASRATGYSLQDDGTLQVSGVLDPSDRYGASGLLSTPLDLVHFSNALLDGKLINRESMATMWSSQLLANGDSTGHGLGWDLNQAAGAVSKGGTSYDATSYLYLVPSRRLVVAINTNLVLWDDGRENLAGELAGIFSAY